MHYFLGPTPMVEDGEITHVGGVYYKADIDLKHQAVGILERDPTPGDKLVALVHTGFESERVDVHLVDSEDIEGDVITWPGGTLPAGAPLFCEGGQGFKFVGLVSGLVEVSNGFGATRYHTFTGASRLRELLATPRVHPVVPVVKHRPDDISLIKK